MKDRAYYLPRLAREFYQGDAVIHWTLTVFDHGQGWLNEIFHVQFRELLLHVAVREKLVCPVYCLMPDHIHLMWLGLALESDQFIGMAFLRTYLEPLLTPHRFQPQAYDHVLKEEERRRNAFAKTCFYILDNPVRAGLVANPSAWKFSGAVVPGFPRFHPLEPNYWPKFWKHHEIERQPDAGQRKLPERKPVPSQARARKLPDESQIKKSTGDRSFEQI